jgi:hypothetical protein
MEGGCLCGAVHWRVEPPLTQISHCHCSRCRKAHGSAYATYAAAPRASFASRGEVARFESSPGFFRPFCPRCGSVVPDGAGDDTCFVPLGGLDEAPPVRATAHIFTASKAPWFELSDALPRFDAYPPGFSAPVVPGREIGPRSGPVRGSCLCGAVAFELREPAQLARFCHCSRCRKARAAAHAANLFLPAAGLVWTRGAERLVSYKIPEALRFTQCFCEGCGGKLPRVDPERALAVVPMGALDDDPGIRPSAHIFVGAKAAWDAITDALPQHREYEA